jgi:uncharacterized membrane protein
VDISPEAFVGPLVGLLCVGVVVALIVVSVRTAGRSSRIDKLERLLADLRVRVAVLEAARTKEAEPPHAPEPPVAQPVVTSLRDATRPAATSAEPPPLPATASPPPLPRGEPFRAATGPQPSAPEPAAAAPRETLESFVGGRLMLVVGVVVVLFGVGFFLKFAIDRHWIGDAARIAMGCALGVALLGGGDFLRRRGFDVFGQALMGCGLGALYLSNYFACTKYHFIGTGAAFALTGALTAAGAALAIVRTAPFLAYLGFLGGYLAPALLGDPTGELWPLTGWLLLVDAGVVLMLLFRRWEGLDLMALAAAAIYVGAWFDDFGGRADVERTALCVAALVAASLVMGLVPPIVRRRRPFGFSLAAVAFAGGLGTLAAHALLFPSQRWTLGIGVLVFGVACVAFSRVVASRVADARAESESLLGIAVAALATALLVVTSGSAVAPVLSAAGVAIVYAGRRTRHPVLVAGGVLVIALAFFDLLGFRTEWFSEPMRPLLNERVLVFACPCVAMLVAQHLLARDEEAGHEPSTLVGAVGLLALPVVLAVDLWFAYRGGPSGDELRWVAPVVLLAGYGLCAARLWGRGTDLGRAIAYVPIVAALLAGVTVLLFGHQRGFTLFGNPTFGAGVVLAVSVAFAAGADDPALRRVLRIAAIVWFLLLLTVELSAWGRHAALDGGTREEALFRASVWISIAWALYAAVLVAAGFVRRDAALRWTGLAIFALTLGKVFVLDMSALEAVYRIGSFLVLGALLVAASFLYQRSRRDGERRG